MQEMLNSSINQSEKILMEEKQRERENEENHNSHSNSTQSLHEQNQYLKRNLQKMKLILKDKLESALAKQKDEIAKML